MQKIGSSPITPTYLDRETIWVVGFPRSGNTWLARLLGDALNSPISSGQQFPANADEGFERPGPFWIRQRHHERPYQAKMVFIIRDPRDVAVSRSFYREKSLDHIMTTAEGRWLMSRWQEYVNREMAQANVIVKYEGLSLAPLRVMWEILRKLDITYGLDRLQQAIVRQSFQSRMAMVNDEMPYGAVHQRTKVLRKGIIGDWRNHFNRRLGEIADDLFNPLMLELGYETNPDWWKELPE